MTSPLRCLVLSLIVVGTRAFEWLRTPGTVHACVGGQVAFPWSYNATEYAIQMTYWRFKETGKTVLGHHFEPVDQFVHYGYGADRVGIMDPEVANAGLILKKIQTSDAGTYRVELSGPAGANDDALLKVYTAEELHPTLQIDNHDIEFGRESNITACKACIVVITTAHALPADITVSSGEYEVMCIQKTTCSMSLHWAGDRSKSMRIRFEVDYGFCEQFASSALVFWGTPVSHTDDDYTATSDGDTWADRYQPGDQHDPGLDTSLIIGVVIGCLVTIIIILIILVCLMYLRMKRRSKKGKNLSRNQDRFMTTIHRWRQVANKSKAERSRAERSAEFRRSFSVPANNEPEGISLSPLVHVDVEAHSTQEKLLNDADRADPDGQDGPKVIDDPDVREDSPSTDGGMEPRGSELGSVSPACSRLDSIDSSSYVMVSRNPDGSESNSTSNSNTNTLNKGGVA